MHGSLEQGPCAPGTCSTLRPFGKAQRCAPLPRAPPRLPTTVEQGVEGCLEAPPHGLGQAVEVTGLLGPHPYSAVVPLEPITRTLEQGPWRPAVPPPLPLGKARCRQWPHRIVQRDVMLILLLTLPQSLSLSL